MKSENVPMNFIMKSHIFVFHIYLESVNKVKSLDQNVRNNAGIGHYGQTLFNS